MITPAKETADTLRDIRRGYNEIQRKEAEKIFFNNLPSIEEDFQSQLDEVMKKCEDGNLHFPYEPSISVDIEEFAVRKALGQMLVEHIKANGYGVSLHPNITAPDYLKFYINVGY
jgi:protein tyrosine phosphatase (PTP) superfamily phosphohydrolase (DUF442 family)